MKRKINHDEEIQLMEKLAIANAKAAALHHALAELVAYVERVNGFMEHKDQVVLRNARALVTR